MNSNFLLLFVATSEKRGLNLIVVALCRKINTKMRELRKVNLELEQLLSVTVEVS